MPKATLYKSNRNNTPYTLQAHPTLMGLGYIWSTWTIGAGRVYRSNRGRLSPYMSTRKSSQSPALYSTTVVIGMGTVIQYKQVGTGFLYVSSGGSELSALPLIPGTPSPTLRTRDKNLPFTIDFSSDLASSDYIVSAQAIVMALSTTNPTLPAVDVTSTILQSTTVTETKVSALLGNQNAVLNTSYTLIIVVTLGTGEILQESIDDILCDQ